MGQATISIFLAGLHASVNHEVILSEYAIVIALMVTTSAPTTLYQKETFPKSNIWLAMQISRTRAITISNVLIMDTKTGRMKRAASLMQNIPPSDSDPIKSRVPRYSAFPWNSWLSTVGYV